MIIKYRRKYPDTHTTHLAHSFLRLAFKGFRATRTGIRFHCQRKLSKTNFKRHYHKMQHKIHKLFNCLLFHKRIVKHLESFFNWINTNLTNPRHVSTHLCIVILNCAQNKLWTKREFFCVTRWNFYEMLFKIQLNIIYNVYIRLYVTQIGRNVSGVCQICVFNKNF